MLLASRPGVVARSMLHCTLLEFQALTPRILVPFRRPRRCWPRGRVPSHGRRRRTAPAPGASWSRDPAAPAPWSAPQGRRAHPWTPTPPAAAGRRACCGAARGPQFPVVQVCRVLDLRPAVPSSLLFAEQGHCKGCMFDSQRTVVYLQTAPFCCRQGGGPPATWRQGQWLRDRLGVRGA